MAFSSFLSINSFFYFEVRACHSYRRTLQTFEIPSMVDMFASMARVTTKGSSKTSLGSTFIRIINLFQ